MARTDGRLWRRADAQREVKPRPQGVGLHAQLGATETKMLTDRELQTLRNLGNEGEAAADEIVTLRELLRIYVHAHRTGNSVAPHIDAVAHKLLTPNAGDNRHP